MRIFFFFIVQILSAAFCKYRGVQHCLCNNIVDITVEFVMNSACELGLQRRFSCNPWYVKNPGRTWGREWNSTPPLTLFLTPGPQRLKNYIHCPKYINTFLCSFKKADCPSPIFMYVFTTSYISIKKWKKKTNQRNGATLWEILTHFLHVLLRKMSYNCVISLIRRHDQKHWLLQHSQREKIRMHIQRSYRGCLHIAICLWKENLHFKAGRKLNMYVLTYTA